MINLQNTKPIWPPPERLPSYILSVKPLVIKIPEASLVAYRQKEKRIQVYSSGEQIYYSDYDHTGYDQPMNWVKFFRLAVERYRKENPESDLTESEIRLAMLEYLVEKGIATKEFFGDFLLPLTDNMEEIIRIMTSHRN